MRAGRARASAGRSGGPRSHVALRKEEILIRKSKKSPVDRATATIRKASGNDTTKVSTTRTVTQAMKQSPDWAAATDVQTAATVWSKAADALEASTKDIANLRAQLKNAEAAHASLRRDWSASR